MLWLGIYLVLRTGTKVENELESLVFDPIREGIGTGCRSEHTNISLKKSNEEIVFTLC